MLVELLINFTDGHRTAKIMTTKPEFTKPFCLEHAKAGAPYCCRNGNEATILKWERRSSDIYQLLGTRDADDKFVSWLSNGNFYKSSTSPMDLVMIPLGMIDGKPVFVGDELEQRMTTGWVPEVAEPRWATFPDNWTSSFRWPAPVPVYPETRLTEEELAIAANGGRFAGLIPVPFHVAAFNIANHALRHAIDAGQVVLPGDTAARDLAVAQATSIATYDAMNRWSGPVAFSSLRLDLPAIIAGVAK